MVTPLGSFTNSVTGTPVVLVGFGCCMWRYSIHPVMLSSETAGVLGCAGERSMTVPSMTTLVPLAMTLGAAWTVVAVCPLSKPNIIGW